MSDSELRSPSPSAADYATPESAAPPSGLISRILPAAIKLWLRSQLDHIQTLELTITGGDRQILSGYIPQIHLLAANGIYQGLHLTQANLTATQIRINLGQILRGKPLRLLNIVPVEGTVTVSAADLNASAAAPLLAEAISTFLISLLQTGSAGDLIDLDTAPSPAAPRLELEQITFALQPDLITLTANLKTRSGTPTPLTLRTGLDVVAGSTLVLRQPTWLPRPTAKRGFPLDDLDGYAIALGDDVHITTLRITAADISFVGTINVIPTEP